jgi:hypothetical protein
VFFAHGDPALEPFHPGTSDSAWTLDDRAAAVQVAYDPANPADGLGQFLNTQLFWVRNKLDQLSPGNPVAVFRFVQPF